MKNGKDYEIHTDGKTVWINGVDNLLGRFGPNGIDIHVDGLCSGEGCVPGPTDIHSWNKFKIIMLATHKVRVSDRYIPKFLKPHKP